MKHLLILTATISSLAACTKMESSHSETGAVESASTAPTPTTPATQWNARTIANVSCSGIYQVNANGVLSTMTIFADSNGKFTGVLSIPGQNNESVSGTCANGQMNFSVGTQQYVGSLN